MWKKQTDIYAEKVLFMMNHKWYMMFSSSSSNQKMIFEEDHYHWTQPKGHFSQNPGLQEESFRHRYPTLTQLISGSNAWNAQAPLFALI